MRYGTLCSGIETAALAVPAHWEHVWCAEVDPFCCDLIRERYPNVENHGDITKAKGFAGVDVLISGTPCQSFSVQGNRRGMDDARGRLAFEFCRIVREVRPRWIVWENVANVLRVDEGRAFGSMLSALAELRYGVAYRVLDAQYFGVPQRRRRVFLVGHHYDQWQPAAAVLFDGRSDHELAASAEEIQGRRLRAVDGSRRVLGWSGDETPKFGIGISPTLRASQGGEGNGFVTADGIARQFTITELERLQGIPDGYTQVGEHGTSKRKKAIGNAFCVKVVGWIAGRIDDVQRLADA